MASYCRRCARRRTVTSANVVRGMLDSLAVVLGPLLAAVLLAARRRFGNSSAR